jgi:nitroimidazol reductase NimA-like FMN-containing flavoprotein (pyridoxamine 5'-phosphate oxidase superfamily)
MTLPSDDARNAPGPGAPPSRRTRIRRIAENARYDRATVQAIVDAALMCHVAFFDAEGVHCIPTGCWRIEDHLYIHGSNGSRMLKILQSATDAVVSITHIDGLVLARSAFNHTMNYRSVVIYGPFELVPEAEKGPSLAAFMEHLAPGRQTQTRPGDATELAATTVLRISLAESAAKLRTGPPEDDAADMGRPVWAGVLPLVLTPQPAQRDPACNEASPEHAVRWEQRRF